MTDTKASAAVRGLSSDEAAARLAAGRGNLIDWSPSRSFGEILRENAGTPVNIVLFIISGALVALGLFIDALLTGGLVLMNIVVGVFQEARAKRQLDHIALLNRPQAAVIRDGIEKAIPPEEIVEGDVLVLNPGDQVLVDGPVLSSQGLGVDESLLTGEPDIVAKDQGDNLVSGSFCVTGSGLYEAGKVGSETVANQITARARSHKVSRTPLQREVGIVIGVMSLVVIFLGAQVARSLSSLPEEVTLAEAVRSAAVIVALVPQGLAVMVTVTYALAAVRLAGSGVLVQRMNAVESISRVDVLCVDKTGTLTTNRLVLETLAPFDLPEAELRAMLTDFAASASSSNRTLDAVAQAMPADRKQLRAEVPFSSARKWSALQFEAPGPQPLYVLGAPDMLADSCPDPAEVTRRTEEWAAKGLRVLLLGRGEPVEGPAVVEPPTLPQPLIPLGLVILRDETRPDASEVVREFQDAGIELKIISGDHPDTVMALAMQAGIELSGGAISAGELAAMSQADFDRAARESSVFGRVVPQVKEDLVRALQRDGRYVAMIGDGVNDVPALKAANVSVAMRSGSAITRSVADLVLLRDEFSRLPSTFREGQRIRRGMDGVFKLLFTRTLSLTLIVLIVSLMNDPFPVTPRQNAVIALLTVGIPTLGIAVWARPGRTGKLMLLSSGEFIIPAAIGIALVGLSVFEMYLSNGEGNVEEARSALAITSVLAGLLMIPFLEPPTPMWTGASNLSGDWRPTILAAVLFGVFIAILSIPAARDFYELQLLDVWGFIMISLAILGLGVVLRWFWRLTPTLWFGEAKDRLRRSLLRRKRQ